MNTTLITPSGKVAEESAEPARVSLHDAGEKPALVIGDLHGHLDRLEALLKQEGLLDRCEECEGTGQGFEICGCYQCEYGNIAGHGEYECGQCDGTGWARTKKPAEIILVGDIGHFGMDPRPNGQRVPGSATADLLTWRAALTWADVILWGNHDRALVSNRHAFGGYIKPNPEVYRVIEDARFIGKLKLAHVAHGFLITHAGLHLGFKDQNVDEDLKRDPQAFADWINEAEDESVEGLDKNQIGIRDAIGNKRGGYGSGGILWRDVTEKLYPFRQVFGHSADHAERAVRYCAKHSYTRNPWAAVGFENMSYCIDIGGPDGFAGAACLAGIWLPEERIVRVDL